MPRRLQYRHPQTGKIITKAAYDMMQQRAVMFAPAPEPSERPVVDATSVDATPFVPIRIWTAGPGSAQEKIYTGKPGQGIKPGQDYAYSITTREQYEHARKALKGRWWVDTVDPEHEEIPRCTTCNWTSMSHAAMFKHLNESHGKPQGTA